MTEPDLLFGRLGNRMFQMAYILSKFEQEKLPDIYIQDPKYFEKSKDFIKKWYGNGIGYLTQVSIHVRRGDYVDKPFYVDLLKTSYYQEAISLFPDEKFLVFSDDPEYCKTVDLFKDKDTFQIMERTNEVEDLNLMASCKHNIIANSSFSWWAAYLNPNHAKKVVAPSPKHWYGDGIERTVCPKEWIRL